VRIQQKSSGKTIGFAPRNVLNLDGLMSCHVMAGNLLKLTI